MSIERKGRGFVVRIQPRSETSLLVHWLTEEFGLIVTLAKGARGPKSSFRGKLDLFFESAISISQRSAGGLGFLKETAILNSSPHLRASLSSLTLASQAARLIDRNAERDTPVPGLFTLFREYLQALVPPEPPPSFILPFNWSFLQVMGVAPEPALLPLDPGCRAILAFYLAHPVSAARALQPTPSQTRDLLAAFARAAGEAGLELPARARR
jgi:DNA repair protein RecO (recombination protein O)